MSRWRVLRAMCSCVAVGGGVLIAAYVTSSIVSIAGAVSGAKTRDVTIEGCFHTITPWNHRSLYLTVTDNNRNETTQHVIQHVTSTVPLVDPLARRGGVGPRPLKGCRTEAGGVKLFYEKETIDLS